MHIYILAFISAVSLLEHNTWSATNGIMSSASITKSEAERRRQRQEKLAEISSVTFADDLADDKCSLPYDGGKKCTEGPKKPDEKWYFNSTTRKCVPLTFLGCGGNINQFPDQDTCQETCDPYLYYMDEADTNGEEENKQSDDNESRDNATPKESEAESEVNLAEMQ
ncbi:amyloid-beta A4 protein-like isoform X2 [Rhipicephalus sanguineus]|uniref:amyloid-beta A4 protein-like isoform X2 n=1 Tax=Rhipicephalus sanguineus TaxID=34632 RepID=UPI0020C26EAB|nr:amyloid-beta A4 protein-like isoform X2 [Rhipicephalus sanguineus]